MKDFLKQLVEDVDLFDEFEPLPELGEFLEENEWREFIELLEDDL